MRTSLSATLKLPTQASAPLDAGRIIQLAHAANPANWSNPMDADYARALNEFLLLMQQRDIPFVVVGGIALLHYVPGRNTEDLDIILAAPRLTEIPELEISERTGMFAKASFHGLRIDLLFCEHPFFSRIALEFSAELAYSAGRLSTATIEGLVLLKLFALPSLYRQSDLDRVAIYEADITQLVARTNRQDAFFLNILGEYLPASDLREVSVILSEIRQKVGRFRGADPAAS